MNKDAVVTSERDFRALLVSMIALSLLIPISTFLLVVFGPAPVVSESRNLATGVTGLLEPSDRMVVITWWLLTAVTATWLRRATFSGVDQARYELQSSRIARIVLYLVAFVFASQLLWYFGSPSTENVPQVAVTELIVAALLAVVVVRLLKSRASATSPWWWLGVGPFVVLFLPAFVQSPSTLRDDYHFLFSANELLAPSVGRYPLSSFVSQYSNFLGYPIVPLVNQLPYRFDLTVVVAYLLLLQLFCLLTPCWIALIAKRRLITALALCLPPFVFVTTLAERDENLAVNTYFQGFPLRTVLPTALLTLLVWLAAAFPKRASWGALVVGSLAAFTFLNNPDFGGPAAVAALIVLTMSGRSLKARFSNTFMYLIGVTGALVTVNLVYAGLGQSLKWSYLLKFARIYGSAGFANAPMATGGLPVVIVTGFSLGVLLGLYSYTRARKVGSRGLHTASAFLLFASLWGLLSTVYYAGRSFTSTAVGGHYYQLALVVSGVLLYLAVDSGHVRSQLKLAGELSVAAYVIGFAFFALFVSASMRLPSPAETMQTVWKSGSQLSSERFILSEIDRVQTKGILAEDLSETGQLLPLSNSIELQTGATSLLMFSHPSYYSVAPELVKLQCLEINRSTFSLVIESGRYASLFDDPLCKQVFRENAKVVYKSRTLRIVQLDRQ